MPISQLPPSSPGAGWNDDSETDDGGVIPKTVKRKVVGLIAFGAAAVGFLTGVIFSAATGAGRTDQREPTARPQPSLSYAPPTPSSARQATPISLTDFVVDLAVTEQTCFGSAGCNYTLLVTPRDVGYVDPDASAVVTYQILGGDDPLTGNFEVAGGQFTWSDTKRVQGAQGAQFTAQVTQVLPRSR